jgi:hypothetical protein
MRITKLDSYYVNNSAMDLSDANEMHEQLIDMFEDKIEDYVLIGNGEQVCLALLGDDTGAPLTSISGTFTHEGNEYGIIIPPDNDPVEIKVKLDSYDRDITEKIAIKNLEAKFIAKDIKIVNVTENDYEWKFEIQFKGIDYRKSDYSKMKKSVKVSKRDGYEMIEDIK